MSAATTGDPEPVSKAEESRIAQRVTLVGAVLDAVLGVLKIGVGGIADTASAHARFSAGANLVQLYTGLIYRGPTVIRKAAVKRRRAR
jgi:dihydroorotate dehydrogenase